jgi:Domain of unknown function (DUF4407)
MTPAQETVVHGVLREQATETARSAPRLALAPARGQELTGVLGELAKFYLLDVNGTSLLTRRAAMEMKLIAVMLTINFFFDLAVWTLLWNMVFYAGKLTIGLFSVVALFCGFLFAAIIFVYERQFMTADTYRRWRKVWWPVSIRLCVIALAAAITTQPFEVMVFSGPIQRRIHDESVRVEAHSRLRALEEAQAKTKGAIGQKGTADYQNMEDAQGKQDQAHEQTNQYRAEAQAARADAQRAEAAIRSAQASAARAQTSGQAIAAGRRLAAARSRYEQAQAAVSAAESKAKVSAEDEEHWGEQADKARTVIGGKEGLAEKDVKRLRDWITQIRNALPGQFVVENTSEPTKWQFQDQDYDFFQRLGVINDLYYGRPPRWLDINTDDRLKLSELYTLSDADDSDPLVIERRAADAHTFIWSYWAVIGIAAVIPLLLLALKGLLPIDLKLYYSLEAQQTAGNYEALKFRSVEGLSATYENGAESGNGRPQGSSVRSLIE